jgi:aconitate decarboxylase
VHWRDGSSMSETREAPRGSEHSFAPASDIVDKFRKLSRNVLPERQQEALIEAVLGIETLADSRDMIRLLQTEGSAARRN